MCDAWSALLDEWLAAPDLPLIVRKARNNRGHLLRHASGRAFVPADNSPAHWSLALAFAGRCPTLDEVRETLAQNQFPIAMVLKAEERCGATYTCSRQAILGPTELGWKVAHIENVGLGFTGAPEMLPIESLQHHMRRFLSPANMFLVPKPYAGVAETPEFLDEFRRRSEQA